eukprot:UN01846
MDGRGNRPNHRPQHINIDQADQQRPGAPIVPNINQQQMQITDRGFQPQPVANNTGNPNHFGQGNLIGPGQLGNFQPPVNNIPNGGHPANTDIPARHDPIGPLTNMNNGPNPDHMRAPNTLTPPGNPRQPPPGAPGSTGGFNGFY